MAEHTPYQKKIIEGYYEHRDGIMLGKLGEIVTELFLAESGRKRDQLWTRAEKAMKALSVPASVVTHILAERKPDTLARHLREWQGGGPKKPDAKPRR